MFGMGFMEIFLVLIVAVIALGPEKLPGAVVDIAKFFKKIKGGIDEAKSTIDQELNIVSLKQETQQLKSSVSDIKSMANINLDTLSYLDDIEDEFKPTPRKREKVVRTAEEVVKVEKQNSISSKVDEESKC